MRCPELPVHLVRRARHSLVSDRGSGLLAADGAAQTHPPHQAFHRTAGHRDALPAELAPDLAGAVDPEIGRVHPLDLLHEHLVLPSPRRGLGRIGTLREAGVVARRGDPQHPADRLDPVDLTMIVDEGDHGFERRSSSAIAKYADALRRISLAWRSSRTSRSSALIRSCSAVVDPVRRPWSRSAWRTHLRRVSAVHPILAAIEPMADHCEAWSPPCSNTIRTARCRTSGENRFEVFFVMAPPSQGLEPPANPARFSCRPPLGRAEVRDQHGSGAARNTSRYRSRNWPSVYPTRLGAA